MAKEKYCARFAWWAIKTYDSAIKFHLNIEAQQLDKTAVFRLNQTPIENLAGDHNPMHATSE